RHAALAAGAVLALPLCLPGWLLPLAVQRAMGPSAEAAIADANRGAGGDYTYSLEREYSDAEGRTVYRLVTDSDPAIHRELRYGFRWFPEMRAAPGIPLPYFLSPGPYYETVNDKEWREEYAEWRRVWELPHQPGARGGASDSEGRG
ncbi:hypothetical protein B5F40_15715, partial [Gordonibacter sp. An230]|uniref:hypothetical protein n=1 Tax=Gordonibacter sp. An230 TaxID=1965592 RepID=UPI000B565963